LSLYLTETPSSLVLTAVKTKGYIIRPILRWATNNSIA